MLTDAFARGRRECIGSIPASVFVPRVEYMQVIYTTVLAEVVHLGKDI